MKRCLELLGHRYEVSLDGPPGQKIVGIDGSHPEPASLRSEEGSSFTLTLGKDTLPMEIERTGEEVFIQAFGRAFSLRILDPVEQASQEAGVKGDIARAPMPGVVVDTFVKIGDYVKRGAALMTIESMKILTVIKAPRDGYVVKVHVEKGKALGKNAALVTIGTEMEKAL